MTSLLSTLARAAALLGLLAASTLPAVAQTTWPDKPVRVVVPAPPASSLDVIVRTLGD